MRLSDLISRSDGQVSEAAAVRHVRVPGILPEPIAQGVFGDPQTRLIVLRRPSESERSAGAAVGCRAVGTIRASDASATPRAARPGTTCIISITVESPVVAAAP